MNQSGYRPYTPNTKLLYGLHEALDMILGEGLENTFARHQRLAAMDCLSANKKTPPCARRHKPADRPLAWNLL